MAQQETAFMPAWRLRDLIREKKLSPVEATREFLARIERLNPKLNAYLTVCAEDALASARAAEDAVMRGRRLGPLHGVPISIKDLNPTRGIRTTMGSLVHIDWVPDQDDIVVERVRRSGAVILGKTNTPEFGHRGTTENLLGDACRNPWDTSCTAGGSSGGAAAALAAGLCSLATGSDGGGSIRIPAGFCGVFGIKPTQGRVPNTYTEPGAWRPFSQNGPLARTVRDAAILLQVLAGPDLRDPTSLLHRPPRFEAALVDDVRGLRVAWSPDLGYAPVDPEVRAAARRAVSVFEELGAIVEEATPEIDGQQMRRLFRTIWFADHGANYGHLLEQQAHLLMPSFRLQLEHTRKVTAAELSRALRELEWHRARMARFFAKYDLLLTPTLAVPAFPVEQAPAVIDGKAVNPDWGYTPFSYPINLGGQPAASVPCGFSSRGLPIGLHVVGPKGAEATVLRACHAFEQARPWAERRPPVS